MKHLIKALVMTICMSQFAVLYASAATDDDSKAKGGSSINETTVIKPYTLTFTVDGEVINSVSLMPGTDINMYLPETPVKEGFTFTRWGNKVEEMPYENITLYAIFKKNLYTITFEVEGETPVKSTLYYGEPIDYPTYEKKDYKLVWETGYPTFVPAHDVTVKGSFVQDYLRGDADGDGKVTIADANAVVNELVQTVKPRYFNEKNADADNDGTITMDDAKKIIEIYLGK